MHLTSGQKTVLTSLAEFGQADDVALSVYVHHVAGADMSSSGVRTRRAELARKGLVRAVGTKKLKSGRSAAIHAITARGQRELARLARQGTRKGAAV